MGKTIKDHLENTFEDLGEGNLKRFKIKLRDRKEEPRVRQAAIEKVKDALDLSDLMVNTFTLAGALTVTLEILEVIGCNEQAKELIQNTGYVAPVVPQPGSSAPSDVAPVVPQPGSSAQSDEHFIDRNWKSLVERVSSVDAILDDLLQKKVITYEDYSDILRETTPQKKMRALHGPIRSAGTKGKDVLYGALMETQLYLMKDLGAQ